MPVVSWALARCWCEKDVTQGSSASSRKTHAVTWGPVSRWRSFRRETDVTPVSGPSPR